ncbi:hypothetical protein NHQ30_008417 [Ciborinia camelliae]|nr:hypothetical protein NHQ30_008417 [Ciborinia camelliae]
MSNANPRNIRRRLSSQQFDGHYYILNSNGLQVYCNPQGWKYIIGPDFEVNCGMWITPPYVNEYLHSSEFSKEEYDKMLNDARLYDVEGNVIDFSIGNQDNSRVLWPNGYITQ